MSGSICISNVNSWIRAKIRTNPQVQDRGLFSPQKITALNGCVIWTVVVFTNIQWHFIHIITLWLVLWLAVDYVDQFDPWMKVGTNAYLQK